MGYKEERPLSKYTIEECANMTHEEFIKLLKANNEYVRKKYEKRKASNEPRPTFNSIEEIMEYYNAIPMEDVIKNAYKLFDLDDPDDVSHLDDVSDFDKPDDVSSLDD